MKKKLILFLLSLAIFLVACSPKNSLKVLLFIMNLD